MKVHFNRLAEGVTDVQLGRGMPSAAIAPQTSDTSAHCHERDRTVLQLRRLWQHAANVTGSTDTA